MSFLVMSKSQPLQQFHDTCWVGFMEDKFWGISADQLGSTHPICCEIAHTGEAESIFDGISYGKGAAWLKQLYYIIGHENMSSGLRVYFQKHEWGNTTLPDFVRCLEDAYRQSGEKSLGEGFDVSDWCDSWLNTSGINIIEPVVEVQDGRLASLKIRQSLGLKGKNRLRLQRLNVSIYEAGSGGGAPVVISGVVIGDKEELTSVDISGLPQDFQYGAVFVNEGEHAYAKVRFDPQSVAWFTDNLHTVGDALTRTAVWHYFWMLVMDKKLGSLQYIEFVQKQLPLEPLAWIMEEGLFRLKALINYYVPADLVKEKKEAFFETLVTLLAKEGVSKDPIVDQLFGFLSSQESIQTALGWLESGKIAVGDGEPYEINTSQKHSILKALFKSKDFATDVKMELLEMTLGEDKSDIAL